MSKTINSKDDLMRITDALDVLEIGYTIRTLYMSIEKEGFDPIPKRIAWVIEFEWKANEQEN